MGIDQHDITAGVVEGMQNGQQSSVKTNLGMYLREQFDWLLQRNIKSGDNDNGTAIVGEARNNGIAVNKGDHNNGTSMNEADHRNGASPHPLVAVTDPIIVVSGNVGDVGSCITKIEGVTGAKVEHKAAPIGLVRPTTSRFEYGELVEATRENYRDRVRVENYFTAFGQKNKDPLPALVGKTELTTTQKAGWGHLIQSMTLASALANTLGMEVLSLDPEYFMGPEQGRTARVLHEMYEVIQKGGDINGFINGIHIESKNIFEKAYWAVATSLLRISVSVGVEKGADDTVLGRILESLTARIGGNRAISGALLRSFTKAIIFFSEKPYADFTKKLIEEFKPLGFFTAHPAQLRALNTTKLGVPALAAIPDQGYGPLDFEGREITDYIDDLSMLGVFTPPPDKKQSNTVYCVPSDTLKDLMDGIFHARSEVVVTGTLSDTVSPAEFVDKWRQPVRNVLLSTNGNGSNIADLYLAVKEFTLAGAKRTSGYRLTVFLGEHSGDVIGSDFLNLLETNGISTIRTAHQVETAQIKQEYIKAAHVEFKPGGENVLTDGKMGCAPVSTWSESPNEARNTAIMLHKNAAIASAWPSSSHKKWEEYFREVDPNNSYGLKLDPPADNFVDYLDRLFGEEKIAQNVAMAGFVNLDSLSTFQIMLIMVQMIENNKSGRHGIEPVELDHIKYYVDGLRRKDRAERIDVLEASGFPIPKNVKESGFSGVKEV